MKTRTSWIFCWMLLVGILLLSVSCSTGTGNPKPESKSDTYMDANYLLADPAIGLDGLKSYHMQITQEFAGVADGKPVQTKVEHNADVVTATKTEFVTLQQAADDGTVESFLTGAIGNASYSRSGDKKAVCHVAWNSQQLMSPVIRPVDMVPAISTGEKVGLEEVNSIKAVHYRLNNASLGESLFDSIDGNLWLAETGGFIVKFDVLITGSEKIFGEKRSGKEKISYELTKINTNDDFIIPVGCQPVLDGVPIMTDAVNEYRLPEILRYNTPSSPEKVLAYYKEQLTAQGWQTGSTHEMATKGQVILFIKTKNDERLHLSLTPEKDTTLVSVSVSKPPQVEQTPGAGEPEKFASPTPAALDPSKAGLPEGVPIYLGAENFTGIPGLKLDFTTGDPAIKVLDFYKTNLSKGKWTQSPGAANQAGVPVMFRKDNTNLMIRISEKDGVTQVQIIVFKQ